MDSPHIIHLTLLRALVRVSGVKIILAFGNYMNSSKRGSAYGFRLQSLDLVSKSKQTDQKKILLPAFSRFFAPRLQLLDTKSTDRKETLMHFIVRIIQEKYPEVQNFYSELHFLDKAALGEYGRILGFGIHDHCLLVNWSIKPSLQVCSLAFFADTID